MELMRQKDDKKAELDLLSSKLPEDLWMDDLDALEHALDDFEAAIKADMKQEAKSRSKAVVPGSSKGQASKPKKKAAKAFDSDMEESDIEVSGKLFKSFVHYSLQLEN